MFTIVFVIIGMEVTQSKVQLLDNAPHKNTRVIFFAAILDLLT